MPDYTDKLAEFDKEWLEKLAAEEEEANQENDEEEEEVEEDLDDEDSDEDDTEDDSDDTEEDEDLEPTGDEEIEPDKKDKKELKPSDKANYTFKKMREEAKKEKEKAEQLERELKELESMATSLGYPDVKSFKEAIEEQRIKKEAERTNRDPEVVKELSDLKKRLDQQELEKKQLLKKQQEDETIKQFGEFISENNLSEDEFSKVLEEASKDGFSSIDDFVGVRGVKKYLKGVATDIIREKQKQKALAKEKKKSKLTGDKHKNQQPPASDKTLEELVEEEVYKEYGIRRN